MSERASMPGKEQLGLSRREALLEAPKSCCVPVCRWTKLLVGSQSDYSRDLLEATCLASLAMERLKTSMAGMNGVCTAPTRASSSHESFVAPSCLATTLAWIIERSNKLLVSPSGILLFLQPFAASRMAWISLVCCAPSRTV